jgi:iron(III) transport system substrate-binding protein
MNITRSVSDLVLGSLTLALLLFTGHSIASSETIDDVYNKALKEGGTLNYYSTLAQVNASEIIRSFETRFPGMKVNHVNATADVLLSRAITEARGGRTVGDIFQTDLQYVAQLYGEGLLEGKIPPEEAAYPKDLKGSYWVASDVVFTVTAWNTNQVKNNEEPKRFEDFADAKWKNKLIAEPRDGLLLIALAKHKYKSDEKATALLKQIAMNNVNFHKGFSQLAELLVAGQAAACVTCLSHHYPPRIKKGAPLNYSLIEGIGSIAGTAIFKRAPHPNTAWLWARWAASEGGQKAFAQGGRTPAHPKVEPADKTRPQRIYALGVEDLKQLPKYNQLWKEIFQLR